MLAHSPGGKVARALLDTNIHAVPGLGISGAIPMLAQCSWCVQGQLHVFVSWCGGDKLS